MKEIIMTFQCYTPRASLRSASIGGLFVLSDGTRHVVPDPWLLQATLGEGGRLLRLSYTFCTIEMTGQRLEAIFEDASIGKLGAVQAAPSRGLQDGEPWVSGILFISDPAPPESHFRRGVPNA